MINLLPYLSVSLLILRGADVEPLGDPFVDGTELVVLSALSLPQLGRERSQLLFPLVSKLHDDVQVLCVLQKEGRPVTLTKTLRHFVFLPHNVRMFKL